jgi:hypothetical protein
MKAVKLRKSKKCLVKLNILMARVWGNFKLLLAEIGATTLSLVCLLVTLSITVLTVIVPSVVLSVMVP